MASNITRVSRGMGTAFVSLVLGILAVPAILMVLGAVFWGFLLADMNAASVEGPAPDGSYEVRRDWGERHLNRYFGAAEQWIRENEEIESDIGPVTRVAPIGGPNKYCRAFGDCWATMNLQVIGVEGEGVIGLSEISFDGVTDHPYIETAKEPWRYELYDHQDKSDVKPADLGANLKLTTSHSTD